MNTFKLASSTLLLSSAIIITGCGSDGDSAGTSAAAVPKDAIVLDANNADTVVNKAITTSDLILAKGTEPSTTMTGLLSQIINNAQSSSLNSGVDLVTGVAFTEVYDCADPGTWNFNTKTTIDPSLDGTNNTYSDNLNATINGDAYSASGSTTFTNCDVNADPNLQLDGSLNWTYSGNDATGNWNSNATGTLTMTEGVTPIDLTNLAMTDSGNDFTGAYETSRMQYTYNPGTGGWALNMTTNIVGNDNNCGPTAGVVEISGANGTKARVTFNADQSVTVEVNAGDGTYVETVASPITSCVLT